MDDLRTAVQHASIEQKDPLVIYKKESYNLFTGMLGKMSKEVIGFLSKANLPNQAKSQATQDEKSAGIGTGAFDNASINKQQPEQFSGSEGYEEAMANSGNQGQQLKKRQPITATQKIGRNERVEIRNIQTGETKTMKFKQAEPLMKSGQWMLVKQEA
jgi:preprotein translocase subunit SecA